MPIKIITLNSCSIVAQDHSIDIDHRQQDPTIRVRIFHQFLNKTFHHPRSHTLSRVLPSHSHHHNITARILVNNKCLYLIAQDCPRNVYLKVAQRFVYSAVTIVSIRWLRAELYLIVALLEVIIERELVVLRLCLFLSLFEVHATANLLKMFVVLGTGAMERPEPLSIEHLGLEKVLYNDINMPWIFVPDFEVEPLEVSHSICIGLDIELILVTLMDNILQIAALKPRIKAEITVGLQTP